MSMSTFLQSLSLGNLNRICPAGFKSQIWLILSLCINYSASGEWIVSLFQWMVIWHTGPWSLTRDPHPLTWHTLTTLPLVNSFNEEPPESGNSLELAGYFEKIRGNNYFLFCFLSNCHGIIKTSWLSSLSGRHKELGLGPNCGLSWTVSCSGTLRGETTRCGS